MNEKLLLDEIRTIKMMCIVNFIELQEIRRKLEIAEQDKTDLYEYANHTREHIDVLSEKLHGLIKDGFWERNIGSPQG